MMTSGVARVPGARGQNVQKFILAPPFAPPPCFWGAKHRFLGQKNVFSAKKSIFSAKKSILRPPKAAPGGSCPPVPPLATPLIGVSSGIRLLLWGWHVLPSFF